MRIDKQLAIKLRLQGKSYSEIQKTLAGISKSTLSLWLKDIVLQEKTRERLVRMAHVKSIAGLLKRNKNQTVLALVRARDTRRAAAQDIKKFSHENLLLIGVALYWAEGYKRPLIRNGRELTFHSVSLTNSDPKLINAFTLFLREVCGVQPERMSVNLRIFDHINEGEAIAYWVRETGIPREQFGKVYRGVSISSKGKRPFNRLPYGVIQIRIGDTSLFHRIMGWIDGLKNQLPR